MHVAVISSKSLKIKFHALAAFDCQGILFGTLVINLVRLIVKALAAFLASLYKTTDRLAKSHFKSPHHVIKFICDLRRIFPSKRSFRQATFNG
ncbi:MAG: hypothetical protein CMN32_07700 [Saprospirales bacterium]|nr:hypothetical protein [Saprospirales bacterium]